MKRLITFALLFAITFAYSQSAEHCSKSKVESKSKIKPHFKKVNNLIKATYYYPDGSIKEQGFFKDKKLTGTWIRFDKKGNKTQIANYKNGKKVGKWFLWFNNTLKEIDYEDNLVVRVNSWKEDQQLTIR